MPKFRFDELIPTDGISALLGNTPADKLPNATYTDTEVGKAVKQVGDSRYALAAVGDAIEGYINSTEPATIDGYCFGTVHRNGRKRVTLDGLQATPGTGTIAIGDIVVVGTVVAKGTKLTEPFRVVKKTAPTDVAGLVAERAAPVWKVVAIYGTTGAPGTQALIERVVA